MATILVYIVGMWDEEANSTRGVSTDCTYYRYLKKKKKLLYFVSGFK